MFDKGLRSGKARLYAFSLVEILVVIVIIAIVASLLFPVLSSAKKAGKAIASTSNLRNIFVSLSLYKPDSESFGNMFPTYSDAVRIIPAEVKCSPLNQWDVDCRTYATQPMIGSYGYIRGVEGLGDDLRMRNYFDTKGVIYTIMIDLFIASSPPDQFTGNNPTTSSENFQRYITPDRTIRLKSDGSIKNEAEVKHDPHSFEIVSWSSLFMRDLVRNPAQ